MIPNLKVAVRSVSGLTFARVCHWYLHYIITAKNCANLHLKWIELKYYTFVVVSDWIGYQNEYFKAEFAASGMVYTGFIIFFQASNRFIPLKQITLKAEVVRNTHHMQRLLIHRSHQANGPLDPAKTKCIHSIDNSYTSKTLPRWYSTDVATDQNSMLARFVGLFRTTKSVTISSLLIYVFTLF